MLSFRSLKKSINVITSKLSIPKGSAFPITQIIKMNSIKGSTLLHPFKIIQRMISVEARIGTGVTGYDPSQSTDDGPPKVIDSEDVHLPDDYSLGLALYFTPTNRGGLVKYYQFKAKVDLDERIWFVEMGLQVAMALDDAEKADKIIEAMIKNNGLLSMPVYTSIIRLYYRGQQWDRLVKFYAQMMKEQAKMKEEIKEADAKWLETAKKHPDPDFVKNCEYDFQTEIMEDGLNQTKGSKDNGLSHDLALHYMAMRAMLQLGPKFAHHVKTIAMHSIALIEARIHRSIKILDLVHKSFLAACDLDPSLKEKMKELGVGPLSLPLPASAGKKAYQFDSDILVKKARSRIEKDLISTRDHLVLCLTTALRLNFPEIGINIYTLFESILMKSFSIHIPINPPLFQLLSTCCKKKKNARVYSYVLRRYRPAQKAAIINEALEEESNNYDNNKNQSEKNKLNLNNNNATDKDNQNKTNNSTSTTNKNPSSSDNSDNNINKNSPEMLKLLKAIELADQLKNKRVKKDPILPKDYIPLDILKQEKEKQSEAQTKSQKESINQDQGQKNNPLKNFDSLNSLLFQMNDAGSSMSPSKAYGPDPAATDIANSKLTDNLLKSTKPENVAVKPRRQKKNRL